MPYFVYCDTFNVSVLTFFKLLTLLFESVLGDRIMNTVTRPNKDETEEDLLLLQKQFIDSKLSPSAKLVRCKRKDPDSKEVDAS